MIIALIYDLNFYVCNKTSDFVILMYLLIIPILPTPSWLNTDLTGHQDRTSHLKSIHSNCRNQQTYVHPCIDI